ncbi:MAG: thioredoxin family protein [Ignavibacteria bacterium]|nr:thioredoxin family protein [Ignavibacteria bacterium]
MNPYVFLVLLLSAMAVAQEKQAVKIYNPDADAGKEVQQAIARAAAEGKQVLAQVGGNWCPWCIRLEKLFSGNDTIAAMIRDNYVFVRVNYSTENKNLPLLARYGNPQRFGFPVLLVIDAKGMLLHTQDSGFLEEGKAHSPEKVLAFLSKWTVKALDPKQYLE